MKTALIGYSGFVGGNLLRQRTFDELFNSRNIESITGREFDLLVCAGAPAEKWRANRDPETDLAQIGRLREALRQVQATQVVLISTVDVYPDPSRADESTAIDRSAGHAYGRHRLALEDFVSSRFQSLIVRLPALFGTGLKKNVMHDFMHEHELEKIDSRGLFQFYGLDHLWGDIERALQYSLRLLNVTTEPVRVDEIARAVFGIEFHNEVVSAPAVYDVRSRHAERFGGERGYFQTRARVLEELDLFVKSERQKR